MSLPETSHRPHFGEPLPIRPSEETIAFLERRRSASAMTLGAPGPTPEEIERLLNVAARAPDHGKLAPWRFIILRDAAKAAFVSGLEHIAAGRPDAGKSGKKLGKIRVPPVTVAVVSHVIDDEIVEWEQVLSAGAVCTLMVIAAQAMGYGANWITDWYAYDVKALQLLGLGAGERVAGYIHVGTPLEAPQERVRPELQTITRVWAA